MQILHISNPIFLAQDRLHCFLSRLKRILRFLYADAYLPSGYFCVDNPFPIMAGATSVVRRALLYGLQPLLSVWLIGKLKLYTNAWLIAKNAR